MEKSVNHLYQNIPSWMVKLMESKQCPKCDKRFVGQEIRSIGIREVKSGLCAWCIECHCSQCNNGTITSFSSDKPATVDSLCYLLLEEKQKNRLAQKSLGVRRQKNSENISKEEFDQFKKFMQDVESHADFMRFIGAQEVEGPEHNSDEN